MAWVDREMWFLIMVVLEYIHDRVTEPPWNEHVFLLSLLLLGAVLDLFVRHE